MQRAEQRSSHERRGKRRLLVIASLHHPQELADEIRAADGDGVAPLFPRSMELFTWERAFRKAGYDMEVFWRNLPRIRQT